MIPLEAALTQGGSIFVRQRKELIELIGFETRNKYSIEFENGQQFAFAAEQQKGFLGIILRQFLGHWRTFELHIFDETRAPVYIATHPFRFFFQRLELRDSSGTFFGVIQRRWGIFTKRFDIEDAHGQVIMKVASPFFRFWTFKFMSQGIQVAQVQKKWTGFLKEAFTDADNFEIQWNDHSLPAFKRALVLAASLYIDLLYFEKKGDGGGISVLADS